MPVKKTGKKILKSMKSVDNPMKHLAKKMRHKTVRYFLVIALVIYSGLLVPGFDRSISPLFDSWIVRGLFLLTILAVSPKDPVMGLLLAIAFAVSMFVNIQSNGARQYNKMRTMLENDKNNTGELGRKLGETADNLGNAVVAPLGKVVDVSGQMVNSAVGSATGVATSVLSSADKVTGGVASGAIGTVSGTVGGLAKGTERVARGVVSDIAGGLSGSRGTGEPSGYNIGYKQCVDGKGNGLCRGVGDVGMQTQGLGVPVGFYGGESGANY